MNEDLEVYEHIVEQTEEKLEELGVVEVEGYGKEDL